ncbi:MAG: hypothetical protein CL504_08025 [Actinobacteria bacterium]|jgi:heme exporter protein B|nr:hypothetical protein [Actinomycetota bacterium]
MFHDAFLVARKDLIIERRAHVVLGQVSPLGLLILVVFGFAFDANVELLRLGSAGLFWVAVLFTGLLLVQRTFDVETEDGNLDALRLSGFVPQSIFLGKVIGLIVQLFLLEFALIIGLFVLFDVTVVDWLLFLSATVLGTFAFSVCGALFGALASGIRLRSTLLPLLLIPVLAPVLLAGTRAHEVAFGLSSAPGWNWTGLLLVITAVYTSLGLVAFGPLLEDG